METTNVIEINIGGYIYKTTKLTLIKGTNFFSSLFESLDNGINTLRDSEGRIFVDRNGRIFEYILDYLRSDFLDINLLPQLDKNMVKRELDFYGIDISNINEMNIIEEKKEVGTQYIRLSVYDNGRFVRPIPFDWDNKLGIKYRYQIDGHHGGIEVAVNSLTKLGFDVVEWKELEVLMKKH